MEEKQLIELLDNIKCIRDLFKHTFIDLVTDTEKVTMYNLLDDSENKLMQSLEIVYNGK